MSRRRWYFLMAIKIDTYLMGEITVQEDDLIDFPRGLPGFDRFTRWVLAGEEDESIQWLISADYGKISLPVTSPELIVPDYEPSLPWEALEKLGLKDLEEALILVVLNLPQDRPWKGTANLAAPVVINPGMRQGRQVVTKDDRYSVYTPLLSPEESEKMEEQSAGSLKEGGDV
jgi:flagellar assembly factor FliW